MQTAAAIKVWLCPMCSKGSTGRISGVEEGLVMAQNWGFEKMYENLSVGDEG